jgi:hypothetical protein
LPLSIVTVVVALGTARAGVLMLPRFGVAVDGARDGTTDGRGAGALGVTVMVIGAGVTVTGVALTVTVTGGAGTTVVTGAGVVSVSVAVVGAGAVGTDGVGRDAGVTGGTSASAKA